MPRLLENERQQAVGMLRAGMTHNDVSNHFQCSKKTIQRLLNRLRQTGSTKDRPRSGRPKVTSERQDRAIRLLTLRNRTITAESIARQTPGIHNNRISGQTVRRRLRRFGLRPRRIHKGPMLTRGHRRARLEWARARRRWRLHTWRNIIFSDESRFSLRFSDGRMRVYRRRGERYADSCVQEIDRFGGGSVMVWGGICHNGRTELKIIDGNLNAVKYRDEILDGIVHPFIRQHGYNHVFQHDNARCHVARICVDYLEQNHLRVLPWPALSPDLSPIEHLWDELDRRVRMRQNQPETLRDLSRALVEEWNNMPVDRINTLIGSMRRRCEAVVVANGGHTRY